MTTIFTYPFTRLQEKKLFTCGTIALIASSFLAYYTNNRFDGVIDVHITPNSVQLHQPFFDNIINTILLTLFLFILAKIINNKTRLIDILNTALICRIPLYIIPFFNINNIMTETTAHIMSNINDPIEVFNLPFTNLLLLGLTSIFSIVALISFAILLYEGFKTATNLKKLFHKTLIIIAIVLAEITSKQIVYLY